MNFNNIDCISSIEYIFPTLRKIIFSKKLLNHYSILLLIFVELHWHPAVINSAEELTFIKRNQRKLSNTQDFFIGGSSNSSGIISDLSEYLPNQSGNRNIRTYTSAEGKSCLFPGSLNAYL